MQGCELKIEHIRNFCFKIKEVLHIMLLNPKISFNRRKETNQTFHVLCWMLWSIPDLYSIGHGKIYSQNAKCSHSNEDKHKPVISSLIVQSHALKCWPWTRVLVQLIKLCSALALDPLISAYPAWAHTHICIVFIKVLSHPLSSYCSAF